MAQQRISLPAVGMEAGAIGQPHAVQDVAAVLPYSGEESRCLRFGYISFSQAVRLNSEAANEVTERARVTTMKEQYYCISRYQLSLKSMRMKRTSRLYMSVLAETPPIHFGPSPRSFQAAVATRCLHGSASKAKRPPDPLTPLHFFTSSGHRLLYWNPLHLLPLLQNPLRHRLCAAENILDSPAAILRGDLTSVFACGHREPSPGGITVARKGRPANTRHLLARSVTHLPSGH